MTGFDDLNIKIPLIFAYFDMSILNFMLNS